MRFCASRFWWNHARRVSGFNRLSCLWISIVSVFIRKLIEAQKTKAQSCLRNSSQSRFEKRRIPWIVLSRPTHSSLNRSREQHKTHTNFKFLFFVIKKNDGIYVPRRRLPIKMPSTGKFITCISFPFTLGGVCEEIPKTSVLGLQKENRAEAALLLQLTVIYIFCVLSFGISLEARERAAALSRCFFYFYLNAEYFIVREN